MGAWSRKSLSNLRAEAMASGPRELQRTLGPFGLTAFGVGSTIGAGIFVLTGTVAAQHAGPGIALSFVLAGFVCLVTGLCYAEFAAMVPIAGSAYSYAYATLGELAAWLIGWTLMLEYLFSGSLVAIGWSGYLNSSLADLGWHIPAKLAAAPFALDALGHVVRADSWINLPATLMVLGCAVLLMVGTKLSASVNLVIVSAKVLAVLAVIAAGASVATTAHWHPFIPANTGGFGAFGWSGVVLGAGIVFFAYLGFDAVSTLAEETREPQRNVPIGLFASLAICTALYIGVSLVITALIDYRELDVPDPLYKALSAAGSSVVWLKAIVAITAIVGLISVVLTCLIGQVRIFYAMARDGLLPPAFARIHPRLATPVLGTLTTGGLAAATAGLVPLDILGELISIGTLLAFAVVCIAIPILRRMPWDFAPSFRTPWVPLVPAVGVLSCILLMFSLPQGTWLRLAIWLGMGLAVYWSYGRRNSRLRAPEVLLADAPHGA